MPKKTNFFTPKLNKKSLKNIKNIYFKGKMKPSDKNNYDKETKRKMWLVGGLIIIILILLSSFGAWDFSEKSTKVKVTQPGTLNEEIARCNSLGLNERLECISNLAAKEGEWSICSKLDPGFLDYSDVVTDCKSRVSIKNNNKVLCLEVCTLNPKFCNNCITHFSDDEEIGPEDEMGVSRTECYGVCRGYGEDWDANPEALFVGGFTIYNCNCYKK